MSVRIVDFRPTGFEWADSALCDPSYGYINMFPAENDLKGIEDAKKVCRSCPVRQQCLDRAMARGEQYGVWGGKTAAEISKLRRKTSAAPLSTEDTAALDGVA